MTFRTSKYLLAGLVVGLTGAATFTAVADQDRKDLRSSPSDAVTVDRKTFKLSSAENADPRGGLAWKIAEYKADDGRTCAKPVRVKDGKIGGPDPDRPGELRITDIQTGGDCLNVAALSQPITYHISREIYNDSKRVEKPQKDPLTFIWGSVRPGVEDLVVTTQLGERKIKIDGSSYIALFRGTITDAVTFKATLTDGTTETFSAPPVSDEVKRMMLEP